ncbi:MAG: hypothetical protein Q9205_005714 [Flavoplaca limonia]
MRKNNLRGLKPTFATTNSGCVASLMRIPAALQTLHSDDLTFHLAKDYGWSAALVPGAKRQRTYFELGVLPHDRQDPKKDDYSVDVRAVV